MNRNTGFTLIELMIVVEIIAIVAAMGIPSYLRTRLQANESSAVANLRTIRDAQLSFNSVYLRYAEDFDALTTPVPPFLSGNWFGPRNGYLFRIEGDDNTFRIFATPEVFGTTGWHGFFTDPSGIIRYRPGAEADATCPPLGD